MATKKASKPSAMWIAGASITLHAVRSLCAEARSAILVLRRDKHVGEIEIAHGQVVGATVGKMTGQDAFNHLLMWSDVQMTLGDALTLPRGAMAIRTDALLEAALEFASQLDEVAATIGGPRAVYERVTAKLADDAVKLPGAVRAFAARMSNGARLADLIEASTFSPGDALKICFRLCELGVFAVHEGDAGPSMAAQLAVVDWLIAPKPAVAKKLRADATAEVTTRRPKTSLSQELSRSDLSFDDRDQSFFQRGLEEIVEHTDRFEDLEEELPPETPLKKRR